VIPHAPFEFRPAGATLSAESIFTGGKRVAVEAFTEEWSRLCCERLNARESYREAAADWEDAVVLAMAADAAHGIPDDRAVYLDLRHGQCRGTRAASSEDRASAPIVLHAPAGAWRQMLEGGMDPVTAVMQGKLRLERGSLFVLARYAAAAREMLAAAAEVGGTFPRAS
jgi:putative sterol carrier protein